MSVWDTVGSRIYTAMPGTSMRRLMLPFAFCCVLLSPAVAQDRDYGRSMVVTDRGIVATSHVLASQAGAQILSQGGSAIDAAIAAHAALGVNRSGDARG